jgi:hypothetical protein
VHSNHFQSTFLFSLSDKTITLFHYFFQPCEFLALNTILYNIIYTYSLRHVVVTTQYPNHVSSLRLILNRHRSHDTSCCCIGYRYLPPNNIVSLIDTVIYEYKTKIVFIERSSYIKGTTISRSSNKKKNRLVLFKSYFGQKCIGKIINNILILNS